MSEPTADDLSRAYSGRSVLVTGHTGFKGAWLATWLLALGAKVTGFALRPPTVPSVFADLRLETRCRDIDGDVRDLDAVRAAVATAEPEVVFHLAAQAIVQESYRRPVETLETNVIGTANVLEAIRSTGRRCAVVVVTSDKCYLPGAGTPHREDDPLGGGDPYSTSKAAAEIVTAGLRSSFFPPDDLRAHGVAIATARAGNVIGGGDRGADRIVPDCIRALEAGRPVPVRNPGHVRPWQHVLEPLSGYLLLGMRLMGEDADGYCGAWNFGPEAGDELTVRELVDMVIAERGNGTWTPAEAASLPETAVLRLDASKARTRLGWSPRWRIPRAVERTVDWYRARERGASADDLRALTLRQIDDYMGG